MNASANKEIILRLYAEAVDQARHEQVITEQIVHPDAVMHNALHSDLRGPEVLRSTWRSLHASFSDLRFELDDIIADGDVVAVRGTTTGRHTGVFRGKPATGRPIAQRAHMFYRFEDGRIREVWPLVDHAGLAGQLEDPDDAQLQSVLDLATGFWRARALISGVELGLFTLLGKEPADLATVRATLGLDATGTADFLDALVALGVLQRGDDGRYRNSPAAHRHLDENSDAYVGGFLKFMGYSLYPAWSRLTGLLRTGARQEGQDSFSDWYRDLDQVRGFMEAMDSVCAPVTAALGEAFDWSAVSTVADLGGARGNLVARLVRRHPHLTGECFDLPAVQPLFDEHMSALGTADRVTFRGGDFRTDALPEADVLIFGHILHDWDEETRALLVRRAFDAVRPGGALLIYDELLDDDRRGPARSLLMSLNMKLVRTGGSEYTAEQCRTWLLDAGFSDVSVRSLTATERLVVARRP
ncbi:methyltransferase [Lentzea terrae]|uniref:methyltransferase n=1 Tax=Lentzea terrae TaxID=2200761 RepID=UPI001E49B943|nr:methyltransferase [Lentzea terrae]